MKVSTTLHAEGPTVATSDDAGRRGGSVTSLSGTVGVIVTFGLVLVFAILSAWLTPRGPITTADALLTMGLALFVGAGAGLAMMNRWVFVLAPATFVIVVELARMGSVGPTVDGIHITSMYGMIAFVLGRGLHGLLAVAPIVLGAGFGIALGRRIEQGSFALGPWGWAVLAVGSVAFLVVFVSLARPASTAPILDADGEPMAGSIAELTTVEIGGNDLSLMIRGQDVESPILLYVTGGPGGTDFGAVRLDTGLEQDFVVVTWDQRGAGKSYAALDPTDTFTVDGMVDDTIELTNYLRERFDQPKVFLVGNSWGTTLGALAVQQAPDLYHALVGVGQMVSQRETDILFWEDTLAWAEETGNNQLVETLQGNGPPPYEQVYAYEPVVASEHDWNRYPEFDPDNEMPAILFVPEYTWMDRFNAFRAFLDTNATLYPQLQDVDFRSDIPRLEVPYYMVIGEHEARGRAEPANEWFDMLDAPYKQRIEFEGAGHRAHFDRPAEFADVMREALIQTGADAAGSG